MQNKIKVMFVGSSIVGGGAERVFLNILNSLPVSRYEKFLAITTLADKPLLDIENNVRIAIYGKTNARKAIPQIYSDIKKYKPKYIFTSHGTIAYIFPILRYLLRQSFSVIVRIAVCPSEDPLNNYKSKIVRLLSKLSLRKADLIITQTQFMKDDVQNSYGIKKEKVVVIQNIIDTVDLTRKGEAIINVPFSSANFNIVASGALYSIKGFDLLIQAIAIVKYQITNVRLFILGQERYEKGYKRVLEDMVEKLGLKDYITFLGQMDNPYPYYKAANLFVLSSRKEGFPNVILEALFYGTPVVATDCVEYGNIIMNGENGYVVKKNSISAIAEGIIMANGNMNKKISAKITNYDYSQIFV